MQECQSIDVLNIRSKVDADVGKTVNANIQRGGILTRMSGFARALMMALAAIVGGSQSSPFRVGIMAPAMPASALRLLAPMFSLRDRCVQPPHSRCHGTPDLNGFSFRVPATARRKMTKIGSSGRRGKFSVWSGGATSWWWRGESPI